MNGLIAETDSILKAVLLILNNIYKHTTDIGDEIVLTRYLLNIVGHLVVVPSNPEEYQFAIAFAVLNLMKKKVWNPQSGLEQTRVYAALINYLGS